MIDRRNARKNQTRQAIRAAADRLFAERGFSATTIDDIAAAADVARRTFFRYYGSKADLLRPDVVELLPEVLASLRARPAEEPPFVAILEAIRVVLGSGADFDRFAGPVANLRALAGLVRVLGEFERGLVEVLLVRWGVEVGSEADQLRAGVVAAAAASAVRASVQAYRSRYGGPMDPVLLVPILEQAFGVLNDGCR